MSIEFLFDYVNVVVLGITLGVGFIIKDLIPSKNVNKFIPLIVAVLGIGINCWIHMGITPEILLGGLISGLASTGCYEAFRNLIGNKKGE